MTKIVELRQDRSLININFDGYKLSLDPVPILRQQLTAPVSIAMPSDEQYSLHHAELFSLQNLLQVDPWARNSAYFINRLGEVIRSAYDESTGRAENLQTVYQLSGGEERIKGDYNSSMRFISEKYCVVCDGVRQLSLLDTGNRLKAVEWKEVAKTQISIAAEGEIEARNFLLYDCRLDTKQEQKQISLALGRVQRVESTSNVTIHFMHVHWAKWIFVDKWIFSILETLESKGSLYYCAFEPRAESLIISSNHEFRFRSKNYSLMQPQETEMAQFHDGSGSEDFNLNWYQTDDDIIIKFFTKAANNKDYNIKITAETLSVKNLEESLFNHPLFALVDEDLTTWEIEADLLKITIVKKNSGIFWTHLLASGEGPKESVDSDNPRPLPMEQQPVANLEAPVEECDFPMNTTENEVKIERYHLPKKVVTHTVLLGSNPPLFTTSLRPGFPPALATRQDVDACLWLQQYNPSKPEDWSLRHEGNLHAFGYVQASKQQRKFLDCSPDLNYAIICESHRHIFLYKSKYDTANGLRNRNGPQVSLGKQHLITLEEDGEVLGIATAPNVVTLLTEDCILYLQIN